MSVSCSAFSVDSQPALCVSWLRYSSGLNAAIGSTSAQYFSTSDTGSASDVFGSTCGEHSIILMIEFCFVGAC